MSEEQDIEKVNIDNVSVYSDQSSDTVTEEMLPSKILENIESGAKDAIETGDYLSYSTMLDIYLGNPYRYSTDETESFLDKLLEVLNKNHDLTFEIAWDLPSIIIEYIECDKGFIGGIKHSPNIYVVIKIFESLALYGNPKELFLKGCEIISNLKINQKSVENEDNLDRERFFDIKCHCLFELIKTSMKRITTLYPSRFLAMATTALIHLIHNNVPSVQGPLFLIRRFYGFARDYQPPQRPIDKDDTPEAQQDEEFLQRKLLTSFLTYIIEVLNRRAGNRCALKFFTNIQKHVPESMLQELKRYEPNDDLMERYAELAVSLDIDLESSFKEYLSGTKDILKGLDFSLDDDELSSQVFERCILHFQKLSPLINGDSSTIDESPIGKLILFTELNSRQNNSEKISFCDAITLCLQNLIPGMVEKTYRSVALVDVSIYWSWIAITSNSTKDLISEISKMSPVLLKIYFQALITAAVNSPGSGSIRYVILTLLTRILTLSPEAVSYNFLKDSLITCPFGNIKGPLVGILKDLLIRPKTFPDDLTESLNKVTLKESSEPAMSKETKNSVPPPLPPRNTFIILNDERITEVFALVHACISETFVIENSKIILNPSEFGTLLSYLNLLIVVKTNLPKERLDNIVVSVKSKVDQYQVENKDEESDRINVDILTIALDRIRG